MLLMYNFWLFINTIFFSIEDYAITREVLGSTQSCIHIKLTVVLFVGDIIINLTFNHSLDEVALFQHDI